MKDNAEEDSEGRLATCLTLEDTFLLEIPRNCFKKVMISMIETDIDKKLKILSSLSIFRVILFSLNF